ncbi:Mannitol 2-dehydrogenase [Raoultella planticola]|uniref:Mannitol 2-dehydrogenase n=1 Tax=Raoultella planticola TaxID=575 RepID=A0A485AAJ3_RAOPL|nr:Mannitol 2-dehydrogenase [Raoultella planticola]
MNQQFTWLHIGLGSFHRAHQAWYLHRLIASGDKRWHIAAGNIRQDAEQVVEALIAQNGALRSGNRQPGRGSRI